MERLHKSSRHIIFYFDVLGYKSLLQSKTFKEEYIISVIDSLSLKLKKNNGGIKDRKTLLFSDNCVLCYPIDNSVYIPSRFSHAVADAQLIQRNMLLHGLFIRGSICVGDVYIDDNYIFGEGIIKAYEIENSIAVYPRIVIERKLVDYMCKYLESFKGEEHLELPKGIKAPQELQIPSTIDERNMFTILSQLYGAPEESKQYHNSIKVRRDFDGQYFVDMLQNVFSEYRIQDLRQIDLSKCCIFMPFDHDMLLDYGIPLIFGMDYDDSTEDINCALCLICSRVLYALNGNKSNPKVYAKYLWFCSYIDQFYKEIGLAEPFSAVGLQ